jgi:chromosome segregation ATPase
MYKSSNFLNCRLFEAELTKQQEKIQRYKADRKVYDESRVETTCLVQSLQQTISSQEQDYLRRETEWRLLNEDAHKASTIINDLRLQLQLQGAVALQHDEDRRNLTAENERLTTQLSSLKQRGAALDTSSTALEREIVELKADRERAIQKIIKRDSKLKDVNASPK